MPLLARLGLTQCHPRGIESDRERACDHQRGRHRRRHKPAGSQRHCKQVVDDCGAQILMHHPGRSPCNNERRFKFLDSAVNERDRCRRHRRRRGTSNRDAKIGRSKCRRVIKAVTDESDYASSRLGGNDPGRFFFRLLRRIDLTFRNTNGFGHTRRNIEVIPREHHDFGARFTKGGDRLLRALAWRVGEQQATAP